MKKILSFLTIFTVWSSFAAAAVITNIPEDHVWAPMDTDVPLMEMSLRTEAGNNGNGGQDAINQSANLSWQWELQHNGNHTDTETIKKFYYEIDGYAYEGDTGSIGLNGNERRAIHIQKDFGADTPTELSDLDSKPIFTTGYAASVFKDGGASPSWTYLRVSRFIMKVRFYKNEADYEDHTIIDKTYGSDSITSGINMIRAASFLADDDSTLRTRVPATAESPKKLAFGVWLPSSFKFNGVFKKMGVKIGGLNCPDKIRVRFWRIANPGSQIEDLADSEKYELTNLEHEIEPEKFFFNIINTYNSPDGTFIADAVGDMNNGGMINPEQKNWGHAYRLEYKFGTEWKYGETHTVDALADYVIDDAIDLFFSKNQGVYKGTIN